MSSRHDRNARTASDTPLFLPEGAFVIQFKADSTGHHGLAGRAEHVVSGQAAHFESPAELLAFLQDALRSSLPEAPGPATQPKPDQRRV